MKKKTFTIIELLIIIIITVILISIMLPALSAAKEKARTNLGINNQRQCGKYLSMAEKDLGGFIVNGSIDYSWSGVLSDDKIGNNLNNDITGLGYINSVNNKIIKCSKSSFKSTTYQHRSFGMPAGDYDQGKLFFHDEYDSNLIIPTSFQELKETSHIKIFLSKMTEPSNTILLTDDFRIENNGMQTGGNTNALRIPSTSNANGMGTGFTTFPHSNKSNVLFGDLSINSLTIEQYKNIFYKKNNICGDSKIGKQISKGLKVDKFFDLKTLEVKNFDGY